MTRLGIALGSGAARGWSHVGVIEALVERGLRPTVVAGASVGSLAGVAYAAGRLENLRDWILTLRRLDVVRLLDARLLGGGLMSGNRVMEAVGELLTDTPIEHLDVTFGAVATDLQTGREVWLRKGTQLEAVRASSGLPGLFTPLRLRDRWLVDGGVVNPVPVSLCYALGADAVIAVNLNAHIVTRRRFDAPHHDHDGPEEESSQLGRLAERIGGWIRSADRDKPDEPGILDVVGASINIMQERITRSRMAGEPPDVIVTPHLEDFQLMDFHRAEEAIAAGRAAVASAAGELAHLEQKLRL